MADDIEKLRRSVRVNRALIVIILFLFLLIIAGFCFGGFYIYKLSQEYLPLIRKFSETDWTLMSDRISRLNPADLHDKIDALQEELTAIREALSTFH